MLGSSESNAKAFLNYTPSFAQKRWGHITKQLRADVLEESGYICAFCGEYCDDNLVLHHVVYRRRRDGGPWPARAEDLMVIHNRPIVDSDGIWCPGHKLGLPFEVVVEG